MQTLLSSPATLTLDGHEPGARADDELIANSHNFPTARAGHR
jgi:hypothetical protein